MVSPPRVITVPYCDENSSIYSLFYEDESIVEEQEIVQIEMEENIQGTTNEQNESDTNWEYYIDKMRVFETTFSAISPIKVIKIHKEMKTRLTTIRPLDTAMVHFYKQQKSQKDLIRTKNKLCMM